MKKIIVILTLIAYQVMSSYSVLAQEQKKMPNLIDEVLNEQKATNKMYAIIISDERAIVTWNACNLSTSECTQNLADSIAIIEKLVKEYIELSKAKPMPDTIPRIQAYSLTGRRLPTTFEAEQILKEYQKLKSLVTVCIKDDSTQKWDLCLKQLKKIGFCFSKFIGN